MDPKNEGNAEEKDIITGEEGKEGEEKAPEHKDEPEVIDWKARFEESEGRRKRAEKKLSKFEGSDEDKPKAPRKSDDIDYGQKAFLVANGIKEQAEMDLVKDIMKNTGKSLDDVIGSKYFQAELKEMRDAKIAADALPTGTKRPGNSAQNTVEYWLAKGELPPASNRELRQKVVNARIKSESKGDIFTNNPVVK